MSKRIFLIGVMGSGKSTIGQWIAKQSSLLFYDSDAEIIRRSGVEISEIFEREGEVGFRLREQAVIHELCQQDGIVLSTGGGCVTLAENRQHLVKYGWVIHLRVDLPTQWQRLRHGRRGKRPLFADDLPALDALNHTRMPLYESIADMSYDSGDMSPKQLAQKILHDYAH